MNALWVAKTGLDAQQHHVSVISNNLANVNTIGFKRDRAVFESLMYQNYRQAGGQSSEDTLHPTGLMIGTGVRVSATQKNFSTGSIQPTENPLDLAIEGRGFFQILKPDGSLAYTRNGEFQVNEQGQMVNSNGHTLQPQINIPTGSLSITIGTDGVVSINTAGSSAPTQIGTITLSDFINPAGLQPIGENLFVETAASGSPTASSPGLSGMGQLAQGALESANVNVVEELVNMIQAQRAYEMNSKAISSIDQMLQHAEQVL